MMPSIRSSDTLAITPRPAESFESACERARFFDTGETRSFQATGCTRLLTNGRKTARACVLFHGITNNPQQWELFGRQLHADGWNVLIPRLPYHGLTDRTTNLPGRLTPRDFAQYTADSVDVAQGLGDSVMVMGLSAGGIFAAWAAQHRADVAQSVIIAPFFGIYNFPAWTLPALCGVAGVIPNQMRWWNDKKKEAAPPPHAYPMFSTRGLAATIALGSWVRQKALRNAPHCRNIVMVNNAFDKDVSNFLTGIVAAEWRLRGGQVQEYCFSRALRLPHDCIDVTQPTGNTPLVYAKLREFLQ